MGFCRNREWGRGVARADASVPVWRTRPWRMAGFSTRRVGKGLPGSEVQSTGLKAFTFLLSGQPFTEKLLCTRYCDRRWGYKAEMSMVCSSPGTNKEASLAGVDLS